MRKLIFTTLSTMFMLSIASVSFAQDGGLSAGLGLGSTVIGLGIAIGLAAAGCGIGQGLAVKGACEGTSRNPDASGKISQAMILGLAFIESLCIYALLIDLIVIFSKL